ncbi:TraB/GumN family protein, partial [Brevundimonas sp.]
MTLANRMGQSANCVSRFAFGMLGALAVSTAILIAPSAKAEEVAAPAPIARAEGSGPPLWVLRDADSTVYLYGTIHVLRPGTAWGSAKVDAAFDSASEIWVEIANQDDQSAVMPVIQQLGMDQSRPLSTVLSAADFAAFDALAKANGASGAALDAYRPWMAAFAVSMNGPLQAGYRPDAGVDKTLMDRARASGKTLRGFETIDLQLRLIAGMSEEGQVAYLNHYVRNADGIVDNLDQTVAAWIKGDAAEVG